MNNKNITPELIQLMRDNGYEVTEPVKQIIPFPIEGDETVYPRASLDIKSVGVHSEKGLNGLLPKRAAGFASELLPSQDHFGKLKTHTEFVFKWTRRAMQIQPEEGGNYVPYRQIDNVWVTVLRVNPVNIPAVNWRMTKENCQQLCDEINNAKQ